MVRFYLGWSGGINLKPGSVLILNLLLVEIYCVKIMFDLKLLRVSN